MFTCLWKRIKQLITASGLGISSDDRGATPSTTLTTNTINNHTSNQYPTINTNTSQSIKNLPPPPPGFENNPPATPQVTATSPTATEQAQAKPVSNTPASTPQRQIVPQKSDTKSEETLTTTTLVTTTTNKKNSLNANQSSKAAPTAKKSSADSDTPVVSSSGLVTHLKQQLNNIHSHFKKVGPNTPSDKPKPAHQVANNVKKQATQKPTASSASSSCVIPLSVTVTETKSSTAAKAPPNCLWFYFFSN